MAKISTRLRIRELHSTEMDQLFTLVHLHNPGISKPLFTRRLKAMLPLGYRAIGLFEGDEMLACSGFWLRTRFWSGRELDIDNFIVHPEHRSKKLGARMLAWFEALAKKEQVELMVLDTYADSFMAQRFYVQNKFSLTGYHLTKIPGSPIPYQRKRQ